MSEYTKTYTAPEARNLTLNVWLDIIMPHVEKAALAGRARVFFFEPHNGSMQVDLPWFVKKHLTDRMGFRLERGTLDGSWCIEWDTQQ